MDGFTRADRAALRDFPRPKSKANPEEQPCQPEENPIHPNSFTWIKPFYSNIFQPWVNHGDWSPSVG